MSATLAARPARAAVLDLRRSAPLAVAALLAASYVVLAPPSADLPAQLFRAGLFDRAGLVLVNLDWYSGHATLGYSVLVPGLGALLTPQLAAALAATATAAVFAPLAERHFGPDAWVGAIVFAAATAIDLYTGRLTLAVGALPALGAVAALDRGRTPAAVGLALLAALTAPVAALFCALGAMALALSRRRAAGVAVAVAALAPVAALALAFPDGGAEPFAVSTLWPPLALSVVAALALPRRHRALRTGCGLYALLLLGAFLIPSPLGSNAARLGTLLAAPLAALLLWPAHRRWLAVAALPLLYLGWMAPVRDTVSAIGDPAATPAYFAPLLRILHAQPGPPFRVEIPFTAAHEEAAAVAPTVALARGWERQADIAANPLFYAGRLTAARYTAWLHARAVRFVAVPDAALDYSARAEARLIAGGLPALRLIARTAHWRLYAVRAPTAIVTGAARLLAMGPDTLTLMAAHPGTALVRVHFSPYWALTRGRGCVAPAGADTRVTLTRPGPATLGVRFSLARVGATSARCRV